MYIEPNSTIKILKNVPFDNSYENTVDFNKLTQTPQNQFEYFDAYTKFTFNAQYYQRVNKGSFKIEKSADELYDCNYLLFRNTSYGNKWFYAFITKVEYVNDSVARVDYELDVMQTWHFDYQLGECFVEREHSATDKVGDNILPEDLPIGDLVIARENDVIHPSSNPNPAQLGTYGWALVVACPFDILLDRSMGITATYHFSGINYVVFTSDNSKSANTKLSEWLNMDAVEAKSDLIFNIFYAIKDFVVGDNNIPRQTPNIIEKIVPDYLQGFKNDYNKSDVEDIPFYPRNNKLYTFPYNFLTLTDYKGNNVDYKFEYFSEKTEISHGNYGYKFILTGDLSPAPSVVATPDQYLIYKSIAGKMNYDYSFILTDFPQCTWSSDAFTAWFAQTQNRSAGAIAGAVIGQGIKGVTNGLLSVVTKSSLPPAETGVPYLNNDISKALTTLGAQGAEASRIGTNVYGSNTGSLSLAMDKFGIFALNKKIRKDYAMIIDSYFDRFGYKTMMNKIPHTGVRKSWTYTKTIGCTMSECNLPADDAQKIRNIYNHGITFWKDDSTVGDYTQDNYPILDEV